MKCTTCGNPVPRGTTVCPYCETPLSREAKPKAPAIKTINVKNGNPPADVAADRMETILNNARADGTKVLIVIHGFGSSGQGGSIRQAVRARLGAFLSQGRVRAMIFGEQFGPNNAEAIRLASEYQTLLAPHVFGAGNEGVTIVAF